MLEKTSSMIMLLDFYGPLLTEKQQHVLNLYYELDLSLSEIAESMNITRQAIYDLVKRAEKSLITYEEKLGLVEKFNHTYEKLEKVYLLLSKEDELRPDNLDEALYILREVTDTVL